MESTLANADLEVTNFSSSVSSGSGKADRKKFLKKTGKSLWMKNKLHKTNALSIEVSTMSSEGTSSFSEVSSYTYASSKMVRVPSE